MIEIPDGAIETSDASSQFSDEAIEVSIAPSEI
jgi:hypothetical protein